jgi:hypothetical protein
VLKKTKGFLKRCEKITSKIEDIKTLRLQKTKGFLTGEGCQKALLFEDLIKKKFFFKDRKVLSYWIIIKRISHKTNHND